jgi:signal transduction histidine kinase
VRSARSWVAEHVPAVVLLALPSLLQVTPALLSPGLDWPLALGLGLGVATFFAGVVVLVGSGWVDSVPELFTTSVAELRRRRTSLVQQTAVLRRVVEELRGSTDRATSATSRLLTELVRAEENTRAYLAAELHDTVAQSMSAALISLADVGDNRHRQGLEALRDAEGQLRTVLARIRPPELAQGNLAQAVSDLCNDLEHRYGAEVDVRWAADGLRLPTAVATLVYRFLQEALLNAIEHADAHGISVSLAVSDKAVLTVEVTDHGPGFDPAAVVSTGGWHVGLKLARERARLAGGDLEVRSAPGAGTQLLLRLPMSWDAPELTPSVGLNGAVPAASTGSPHGDDLRREDPLHGPVTTG